MVPAEPAQNQKTPTPTITSQNRVEPPTTISLSLRTLVERTHLMHAVMLFRRAIGFPSNRLGRICLRDGLYNFNPNCGNKVAPPPCRSGKNPPFPPWPQGGTTQRKALRKLLVN